MKSSLRKLTNVVLLVALGAGIYLAVGVVRQISQQRAPDQLIATPLAQLQVEGAAEVGGQHNAGNIVLENCQIALERRGSIAVDVVQSGVVAGQIVETNGQYFQQGRGANRQFSLVLQGRVGPSVSRIWQVSDGRYVWTDLAWDGAQSPGRRAIKRVDLARIRLKLSQQDGPSDVRPGQAEARAAAAGGWPTLGGLPMLVSSLRENFNFGAPRQMQLRNEAVYAMIGRWKPNRLAVLLQSYDEPDDEPDDQQHDANAAPSQPPLPSRMPHHVLVAIGRDLFPRLIEYRSGNDALSSPQLGADARFQSSVTPLLKMDYLNPRYEQPIDSQRFVYREADGVEVRDTTDARLAVLNRLAPAATSNESRR